MPSALQHFIERACAVYGAAFDVWFPATFDWARLCEDVPAMARRARRPLPAGDDEGRLVGMARAVFPAGHLVTLAVLAASAAEAEDPESLLDHVASPPEEEEEERFTDLASGALDEVELALAGQPAPSPDAATAAGLVGAVWSAVEQALAADEAAVFEAAGTAADVLWAVARVGAILAAFRWMAAAHAQEGWPPLP